MKAIGGYFELELPNGEEYHKNAIRLNTGRNAFEYILKAKQYKKVYLPFYTCDVILEPIQKLDIEFEFYSIDEFFQPKFDFSIIKPNEVFVYNNYFGISDEQVSKVASKCKNLIIDNSQAFYSKPIKGVDTFYSPRKFFGVPDGAYLYTDKFININLEQDISYQRCEHLLGRIDIGAEEFYKSFKKNDNDLVGQSIKKMSNLTQRMLESINYNNIAIKRIENFKYLHEFLRKENQLKIELANGSVPMVYPYLIDKGSELKEKLIENKIFIATFWPNIRNWVSNVDQFEFYLFRNLVAIPIDQRINIEINRYIIRLLLNDGR